MAASIIAPIRSALDDLELLVKLCFVDQRRHQLLKLRYKLRNLKTFLLWARKLGIHVDLRFNANKKMDGSLGSLLVRIEDAVGRNAQEISSYCLNLKGNNHFIITDEKVDRFLHEIECLEEEICEWYITYPRQPSLADEVAEMTHSVSENLVDFLRFGSKAFQFEDLAEEMGSMGEQLAFLANFIRFATHTSVEHEQMEDLFILTETVAVEVAYLCLMSRIDEFDGEKWENMRCLVSLLLLGIRPFDIRVYEIYVRALRSTKFPNPLRAPTQGTDGDPIIVMKNFVESLTSIFWEMLRLDIFCVNSMKDQLQPLYEGLRFLRSILKQQPDNIGEKIRDRIGDVLCDAGVLICSFYQTHVETDPVLQNLLERIMVIRAGVEERIPQTSIFNFTRTTEPGFVDDLLENLMELTSCELESIAKSPVQTIQEEFFYLRSFLGEILELRNEQEELQVLWDRVFEVAYRVEILIDHILAGDISDSLSMLYDSIVEDIGSVKTALKIFYGKKPDFIVKKITRRSSHVPSQSKLSITKEVVGFHDEASSIMDQLARGSKIIAIVGMPRLGKTTLDVKVYNDPSVMCHFYVRAWCPISQVFNKKKVLLELIEPNRDSEMTEQDLAEKLWCGMRYLIFLDDVWAIEA